MNQGWNFENNDTLLKQLLQHAQGFDVACILLSNNFEDKHGKYDLVAGFGSKDANSDISDITKKAELQLGFITYDLKNKFENLASENNAVFDLPDIYFFEPEQSLEIFRNGEKVTNNLPEMVEKVEFEEWNMSKEIEWNYTTAKDDYIKNVENIRQQIIEGDFYELNYCTEWNAKNLDKFNPFTTFYKLNQKAPAPYAAFFKYGNKYLLCSSPERFLRCDGGSVLSQPIKGTRKRQADNDADKKIASELEWSEKDRSENVMITDLVRNDLSKVCINGSILVEELCKVYSFSHVHQLISTISGKLQSEIGFADILKASFPMGSMTGAPKVRVMREIEKYENFRRGWYSGSVGWLKGVEFDLNVVIRSLQFDADKTNLTYHVGGAIVYDSVAVDEYEECLTKASGMLEGLK